MGVPGFFKWLLKRYKHNKKIITYSIDSDNISVLYLDANCLFHPQCFKVLEKVAKLNMNDIGKIEGIMMERIINYIDYLISLVEPELVYIAVDGVAPMAKMNQQRARRFKSSYDKELYDSIKKKYEKEIDIWTNTVITPGTKFMEKLHQNIIKYVDNLNRDVIYSSYHTVGEGEHKILQHIKDNKKNEDYVVIYGLDADLIFLSLASNEDNIYLLREDYYLNNKKKSAVFEEDMDDIINEVSEELTFVSMDEMKICLNSTIIGMIEEHMNCIYDTEKNFSDDFTFLCYLLGNDFLPHLPSIDISIGGLDKIIKVYVKLFCDNNGYDLINRENNKITINNEFFLAILGKLSDSENYYFRKVLPKHTEHMKGVYMRGVTPYEKEMENIKFLRGMNIQDPVRLGEGNPKIWKYRYYEHYFRASNNQKELIKDMCSEYIRGLRWVTEYYFNKCPCWRWFYPYSHSPFISDISDYVNEYNANINAINFYNEGPLKPLVQLLSVLPPDCSWILPKSYQTLTTSIDSPIIDMFPQKIKIDMINKYMFWKCIPIVPPMNIERIKACTNNIILDSDENIRNVISEPYKNNKVCENT